MAVAGRPESRLPLLKCSTCGDEIDILQLADHVCIPSTKGPGEDTISDPSSGRSNMKGDPVLQSDPSIPSLDPAVQVSTMYLDVNKPTASPGFLRPGKNVPPMIDPAAANRPFLQLDAVTPGSDYSNFTEDRGLTPITPSTQLTTPSSMFSRKPAGYPSRSPSPPSPNYARNLDTAFPPFRSRYDAPTAAQQPSMMPLKSPGANVLQRMNGIADGPFSGQARGRSLSNGRNSSRERRPSNEIYGHQRQGSRSQDHVRKASEPHSILSRSSRYSATSEGVSTHARKASTEKTARVVDSIDMFLQDVDVQAEPTRMIMPERRSRTFPENLPIKEQNPYAADYLSPARSAAPSQTSFFPEEHRVEEEQRPTTSAGLSRSNTRGRFDAFKDPAVNNPFIPANRLRPTPPLLSPLPEHMAKPITDSNSPDNDPASPWFEAPRPSPAPPKAQTGRSRAGTMSRQNGPTPVAIGAPALPQAPSIQALRREGSNSRNDISHSPSVSSSSYASSNPSTAPSSVSSLSRNASSDSTRSRNRGISRPQRPEAIPQPAVPTLTVPQSLESPIDPAIHHMRAPLDPAIQIGAVGPRSMIDSSPARDRKLSKPDIYHQSPPRFPTPVSKGECRGCGTHIYGKSVKAADGRLTGRYHKECFVCKTCQAPFLTAEFYVHNNSPYCGQHYHELNGSLCRKCNRGIEGQYLATDRKEKFHSHCFACTHCRVRLNEDYYEVDGRPYCERHAFAMSRQRGPGAPAAEKRRTRLMFM